MKLETYVNAYERAEFERAGALLSNNNPKYHLRTKQAAAFRARILRMDAEKEEEIQFQRRLNGVSEKQIDGLKKDIAELEQVTQHD